MRRLEHLISQVRSSTSNKSTSKISDFDMVNFFNLAQDAIQNIAMSVESGARMFSKTSNITLVENQESYSLPSDIYAPNSITSVRVSQFSDQFFPIERITDKERQRSYGYSLISNKIYISPTPKWTPGNLLEVTYQRILKRLGVRSGTIQGYVSGTGVITLASGYSATIGQYDDFFCIVDSNGEIINENLPLTTVGTGTITTTTGLTITNGQYVVMGKNSTTHSELNDFCERFLTNFVERKIQSVESSSDVKVSASFTAEERSELTSIFSTGSLDAMYPPITSTDYLWL